MIPEASLSAQAPLAPQSRAASRYGLHVAGLRLAFPVGEVLEYLPDAAIYQLPLAPRRLVGLLQLRGHPVAVFDGGRAPVLRSGERRSVLVVGEPASAAALLVDEAPLSVNAVDEPIGVEPPADRIFAGALGPALRDADGHVWWPVEPALLFEALAADEPASADAPGPAADAPAAGR